VLHFPTPRPKESAVEGKLKETKIPFETTIKSKYSKQIHFETGNEKLGHKMAAKNS